MANFIQFRGDFINVQTIAKLVEQNPGEGSLIVLANGDRVHVKEQVRDVLKLIERAESGQLPMLTPSEVAPQLY